MTDDKKPKPYPWPTLNERGEGIKPGELCVLSASPGRPKRSPSLHTKAKAPITKCTCGESLPMHFVDIADEKFTHVCSCEQAWKVTSGLWVNIGTEENAIARLDEKVADAKCRGCGGGIDYIWVSLFHQVTGKDTFPSYCQDCMGKTLIAFNLKGD